MAPAYEPQPATPTNPAVETLPQQVPDTYHSDEPVPVPPVAPVTPVASAASAAAPVVVMESATNAETVNALKAQKE